MVSITDINATHKINITEILFMILLNLQSKFDEIVIS